jgi:hypothetical protein
MNKFEQLIEFVINDEEQKARELFHNIVVEKSRAIYESLMSEEAEEEHEEEEEELDESFGEPQADSSDDLVDEVEMDEVSMAESDEEGKEELEFGGEEEGKEELEFGGEEEGKEELEDRVVDLEDKLDELMAEFEAMMGGEHHDDSMSSDEEFAADAGGDAMATDDTDEIVPMAEALELKAAPKPVTSEEGSVNKKSTVAANAGAKGPVGNTVKPVSTGASQGGRHDAAGAYSNTVKDLGATSTQEAGKKAFKTAAPAPVKTQASGVNTKSPVARG